MKGGGRYCGSDGKVEPKQSHSATAVWKPTV